MEFRILLYVTLGAGFIKFHQVFQELLVMGRGGGGGGGHSFSTCYSLKLCVVINFSLRHNVLCHSFVVVLYSMYLMEEVVMCNKNLMLKSPLKG